MKGDAVRDERSKLLKVVCQGCRRGRPVFLQQRCNLSWHQLGLLQPHCPIDFSSAAMWRQPIMADWLRIDWIVTWNSDLFFMWADRGRTPGCLSRWGKVYGEHFNHCLALSNANWQAVYAYMSDLRAVVSNTLLLTQQPSSMRLSPYSLYFPGVHTAIKQTN